VSANVKVTFLPVRRWSASEQGRGRVSDGRRQTTRNVERLAHSRETIDLVPIVMESVSE